MLEPRVIGPEIGLVPCARTPERVVVVWSPFVWTDSAAAGPTACVRRSVVTPGCELPAGAGAVVGAADGSPAPVTTPRPLVDDGGRGSCCSSVRSAPPPIDIISPTA